jgi:uncharacterized protein (TIGR00251 family)
MMTTAPPFAAARDGLRIAVRLTPKAAADRIVGLIEDGRGGAALKVAVTAPPVDGKANRALLQLLARHFGLTPSDLSLAAGASGRSKSVALKGDPAKLAAALREGLKPWLKRG